MITPEQIKKYIANGGDSCPVCGSKNIEGGELDTGMGMVYQNIRCTECNEEWTDEYRLVDVTTNF